MNCPVCGVGLKLEEVQEQDGYSLVRRSCHHCGIIWILQHQGDAVTSITQEGIKMADYGFDYECPHCGAKSTVYTVYQTKTGWKCISCGKIIPNECIKPRGDFKLLDYRAPMGSSRGSRSSRRKSQASTYQRTPRASRPVPVGAVSLAVVAERLKVEPKKLRSWLRKSNWRKVEEARSAWIFSEVEVEELVKNFRR